jgi:very-short-patch-repair endonuclease
MLKGTATSVRRARKLRREMSLPEVLLWQVLRKRPDGLKFRHQHPVGPYILDFYCDATELCVEVDGEAHERGNRPGRDAQRDIWLAEHGIKVMRVSARDVLGDLDGVVRGIVEMARPSTVFDGPPPLNLRSGEDFS